jgi:hypothetical protein
MKHLIMFLLVHINPNAIFSQVETTNKIITIESGHLVIVSLDGPHGTGAISIKPNTFLHDLGMKCDCSKCSQPDTARAIILVTLSPSGIAHARMGYVVTEQGKRPVYLDCRKRALKWPMVGWDWRYEIVDSNVNLKK